MDSTSNVMNAQPVKNYVIYQTPDVTLLHPDAPYGIEVFHVFGYHFGLGNDDESNFCARNESMKTHNRLRHDNPKFYKPSDDNHIEDQLYTRKQLLKMNLKHNDQLFFRAPLSFPARMGPDGKPVPKNPATDTIHPSEYFMGKTYDEILDDTSDSMGSGGPGIEYDTMLTVKVDPTQTYIYSSHYRAGLEYKEFKESRRLMSDYLEELSNYVGREAFWPHNTSARTLQYEVVIHIPMDAAQGSIGHGELPREYFKCYVKGNPDPNPQSPELVAELAEIAKYRIDHMAKLKARQATFVELCHIRQNMRKDMETIRGQLHHLLTHEKEGILSWTKSRRSKSVYEDVEKAADAIRGFFQQVEKVLDHTRHVSQKMIDYLNSLNIFREYTPNEVSYMTYYIKKYYDVDNPEPVEPVIEKQTALISALKPIVDEAMSIQLVKDKTIVLDSTKMENLRKAVTEKINELSGALSSIPVLNQRNYASEGGRRRTHRNRRHRRRTHKHRR